jgi:hypothetical protein
VRIKDAAGKCFDIYVDHRLDSRTPGAFYLRHYPGKPGSLRVINQRDFQRKIGVIQ